LSRGIGHFLRRPGARAAKPRRYRRESLGGFNVGALVDGPASTGRVREDYVGQVDAQRRRTTVVRLAELRAAGSLTTEHVRLAAAGHGVDERTVWRWLGRDEQSRPSRPEWYQLTPADREAYAHFRGNVTAVARAREAVLAGRADAAGVPVPEFLVAGWAQARPVALRTLQRAFAEQLTPAERAYWASGEAGRRAAGVYLTRPWTPRQ
jgi:putative transposase